MKKSMKALLAAAAATALLIAGAGTVAYWTATGTVTGNTFTSGTLELEPTAADGAHCTGWLPATTLIVPGDVLTQTCTFTVDATGDNLSATLSASDPTFTETNALTGALLIEDTYKIDAVDVTTITDADNGKTLTATITATFPLGETADNTTQNLIAALQNITVTLTQQD